MKRHILPILLIVVISIALYANTLKNGFVYDDTDTIVNNLLIKDVNNLPGLVSKETYFTLSGEASYRPIATFTYFVDYALYGLKPLGYHLTNILLHTVNSVLFYIFLTLIFQSPPANGSKPIPPRLFNNKHFLMSLIFATHPVSTEAVNAISYREDLLAFLFYMATLIIYLSLRSARFINKMYISILFTLSCILYLISLFSKEMAVTLPLIVIGYEWVCRDKTTKTSKYFPLNLYNLGYILITLIYLYFRFYLFRNPNEVMPIYWKISERFLTVPWLLLNYLKLALFPVSLSADYVIDPINSIFSNELIVSFIVITLLLTIAVVAKKEKWIYFGSLFFFITLIPILNIIPIVNPFAERYLYIPVAGLAMITGTVISRCILSSEACISNRHVHLLLLIIIIGVYCFTVIERNTVWKDAYSLWSDTVKKMPASSRAHYNLASVYVDNRHPNEAIQEYLTALKLDNSFAGAYNNLGIVYKKLGKFEEAILAYRNALKLEPDNSVYHYNLGNVYRFQGLLDEAEIELSTAIKLNFNFAEAHYILGIVYRDKGLNGMARSEFETTLKFQPDHWLAHQALEDIMR